MNMSKAKILTVTGAVALTILMYFSPRQEKTSAKVNTLNETPGVFSFDELLTFQKKNLSEEELKKAEYFENALEQDQSILDLYDSIALFWDTKKMFALSASYYETKASKDKTEKSFLNAAYRYFDAYKASPDSTVRVYMAGKAITNYSKVTDINPQNLDAKTDLGILYAESSSEPMKGIMLLRDVVTQKPDHENAQLNLGLLSVKSGQLEKALERFDKVLQINPGRVEVYLYKAQTYEQMGDNQKAIAEFENFNKASNDSDLIARVKEHIIKLKGN